MLGLNNNVKTSFIQQQSEEQQHHIEMKQTLLMITIRKKFRISTAARPQSGWAQAFYFFSVLYCPKILDNYPILEAL